MIDLNPPLLSLRLWRLFFRARTTVSASPHRLRGVKVIPTKGLTTTTSASILTRATSFFPILFSRATRGVPRRLVRGPALFLGLRLTGLCLVRLDGGSWVGGVIAWWGAHHCASEAWESGQTRCRGRLGFLRRSTCKGSAESGEGAGGTATDTFVITVTAVNDAPYLNSDGDGDGDAPPLSPSVNDPKEEERTKRSAVEPAIEEAIVKSSE